MKVYNFMKPDNETMPKYFYVLPSVSFVFSKEKMCLYVGWLAWFVTWEKLK